MLGSATSFKHVATVGDEAVSNNDSQPYRSSAAFQLLDENTAYQRYEALMDELRNALLGAQSMVRFQGSEFETAYVY